MFFDKIIKRHNLGSGIKCVKQYLKRLELLDSLFYFKDFLFDLSSVYLSVSVAQWLECQCHLVIQQARVQIPPWPIEYRFGHYTVAIWALWKALWRDHNTFPCIIVYEWMNNCFGHDIIIQYV